MTLPKMFTQTIAQGVFDRLPYWCGKLVFAAEMDFLYEAYRVTFWTYMAPPGAQYSMSLLVNRNTVVYSGWDRAIDNLITDFTDNLRPHTPKDEDDGSTLRRPGHSGHDDEAWRRHVDAGEWL